MRVVAAYIANAITGVLEPDQLLWGHDGHGAAGVSCKSMWVCVVAYISAVLRNASTARSVKNQLRESGLSDKISHRLLPQSTDNRVQYSTCRVR